MSDFTILCDSLADIDINYADENGIIILPTFYYFKENEVFGKDNNITYEEFYERLKTERAYSSCINIMDTEETFKKILDEGKKIIYLAFSSKCSACYQVANMIKEELDPDGDKIYIYDTGLGTSPISLMIEDIIAMKNNGLELFDIYNIMEQNKEKYNVVFTTNDLEYFVRGGRLKKSAGLIGGMLNIKPVITFKEGEVFIMEKCRGQIKAYQKIIDTIKEKNIDLSRIIINYGYGKEYVNKIIELLKKTFGENINYKLCPIHPSIGTHLGPTSVGISYVIK